MEVMLRRGWRDRPPQVQVPPPDVMVPADSFGILRIEEPRLIANPTKVVESTLSELYRCCSFAPPVMITGVNRNFHFELQARFPLLLFAPLSFYTDAATIFPQIFFNLKRKHGKFAL
jgi:hypothetical protein